MQEKKNIRLLISLVILIALTGLVYWLSLEKSTIEIDKTIFRVDDFKTIDEVTFNSKGNTVTLKFDGTRWRVNDLYEADRHLVDVLFATLQQAEPKRPVAASIKDSISNEILNNGVKVSLKASGKDLKVFYAGGNLSKTQAYFLDGKDAPYIMVIPGYRVYASGILELDENGWRDKRVFNFSWRNFKEFTAQFPTQAKQNFRAAYFNNFFGVEGLAESDTIKLNAFMDGMMRLSADNFIKAGYSARYDSLIKTNPAMIIEIKDIADRKYPLIIFNPLRKDPYVLGVFGNNEAVLFQHDKIAPLVRGKDYFIKKP
ncbi:MAG TPA: hypothetical protein VL443_29200 [Cyclobacteriaceae bacterium]|jgi:hypothetical protein|nr:hypothetical protein [Cyclobacteriaceae bacterium]